MNTKQEWFSSWFDTPFYHILYADRDESEAAYFIDHLLDHFKLQAPSKILDAACGKGRHSLYLHNKGHQVEGFDLSAQSIEEAKKHQSATLRFSVKDLRKLDYHQEFHLVLNLFTSFGYFSSDDEDFLALRGLAQALVPGGHLLVDYLNPGFVRNTLVEQDIKTKQGIDFNITRKIEQAWVVKTIAFRVGQQAYSFKEKVKLIELEDFQHHFKRCGLDFEEVKGNYALETYDAEHSPRMILIASKPA